MRPSVHSTGHSHSPRHRRPGPVPSASAGGNLLPVLSQVALAVENLPANAGDRDAGSIPGSGRCPGGGHGNPLQYSCLENPVDRGAWRATVHRIPKSRTCSDLARMQFWFWLP